MPAGTPAIATALTPDLLLIDEALAVGDDLIDVEMLAGGGRGLAIAGAPQALVDVADGVVESDERVLVQMLHDLVEA